METRNNNLNQNVTSQTGDVIEIDLLKVIEALLARWKEIVAVTLLFAALALAYAKIYVTPIYSSSALLYVNNSSFSIGSSSFSFSSGELNAAKSLVDTYGVILKTRTTLEEVIDEAGLDMSYEKISGMVSSEAVNETEIFRVTVRSSDPEEACLIANTIARVLPDKIADIVDGSSVRVVDYAVTPTHRISPSYTKYTVVGALLGGLLMCAIIFIGTLLDDSIDDEEDLTADYRYPVLAVIPDLKSKGEGNFSYYSSKGYGRGYGSGSGR